MDDGEQIRALIHAYAERIDGGDLDGLAQLFAESTWRSQGRPEVFRGAEQVRRMYNGVILYDGRPCTKHVITNVSIVSDGSDVATARSYFTVLQATPSLPLQPIIAGSYHDEFTRVDGVLAVQRSAHHRRPRRRSQPAHAHGRRHPGADVNDEALVEALDIVWSSLAELGATLSGHEWATDTECPGWTVQDNLAHIIGIEATILGRPNPDHEPAGGPHVKNDVGAGNEIWVDWYRSRSGAEVLTDFRAITTERHRAAARTRVRLRRRDVDPGRSRHGPRSPPVPCLRLVDPRAGHAPRTAVVPATTTPPLRHSASTGSSR